MSTSQLLLPGEAVVTLRLHGRMRELRFQVGLLKEKLRGTEKSYRQSKMEIGTRPMGVDPGLRQTGKSQV